MMRLIHTGVGLPACLLACLLLAPAAGAGSLLGEWKLVEQTYGEGKSNLIEADAPTVRLEFYREGSEVRARIRAGETDAEPLSWPRLVEDTARKIRILEGQTSAAEDRVLTRYRVDPSPGDDLVLEVTEDYRVVEDGRALVGTVRVQFRRDGQDRGAYLLHRRFEREP